TSGRPRGRRRARSGRAARPSRRARWPARRSRARGRAPLLGREHVVAAPGSGAALRGQGPRGPGRSEPGGTGERTRALPRGAQPSTPEAVLRAFFRDLLVSELDRPEIARAYLVRAARDPTIERRRAAQRDRDRVALAQPQVGDETIALLRRRLEVDAL